MSPVSSPSFAESMYANLPDKQRKSLAEATGKRSAACSANQLYKMLGNPDIVAELPRDEFKGRINKSGKIKLWTRIALAIRHFYYALFSQFQKLGKAFADLIPKKGAAKEKSSSQKRSTKAANNAIRQPSTSRNSNWTKDLAANVGISAAGNIIGNVGGNLIAHKLDKKHPEQASDKAEASGSDADLTDLDKKHPATSKDEPSTAESSEKSKHQERSEDSDSVGDGDADSAHHEDVGDSKTHHSDKSHSHDTDDKHDGDEDSDTDAEDSDSDAGDADDDGGGGGWWSRIFGHHGSSDDDYDFD